MLLYLLKTTFCLLLFLGFYHLVLEKEKMHRFNRFYLLGSIVFAFLVPSFIITVAPTEFVEPIAQELIINQADAINAVNEISYQSYLVGLYLLITFLLFTYFGKNIHKVLSKTRRNEKISYYSATIILLKEKVLPHTFLRYIFINKEEFKNDNSEQYILTHELAHVKQKHSLDVLFIELLQIVFWFIPIFKFYKKAVQLNHEFLADDAVIKLHENITEYQHLLLKTTAQNNNIYLASNLNYSLTKKRLLMMTTPSSKTKILFKKLAIIPLITGFIFAFSQKVEAQQKKQKPQVIEVKKQEKSLSRKGMKEYQKLFDTAKKSNNIYKQKDVIKMIALYKEMSIKQQNTVTDIRKIIPPPPPKMDLVFTYKKLADRIQRTSKNRKANVVYLKELYSKMNASQKKLVTKPSRVLPPPPPKPVKIKVKEIEETPKVIEVKELEEVEEIVIEEEIEIIEVVETPIIREVEEVIEVKELKKIAETIVEEVIEIKEVEEIVLIEEINKKLEEYKEKQRIKLIPPPPPLKKNATKKEINRYNKAYKLWEIKIKKSPPPPPPRKQQ